MQQSQAASSSGVGNARQRVNLAGVGGGAVGGYTESGTRGTVCVGPGEWYRVYHTGDLSLESVILEV